MELKERIKLYLKTRNEPVSRNELLSVASAAGASRDDIFKICSVLQDNPSPGDVKVGTWWGFKNNDSPKDHELKTLWLCYYELSDELYQSLQNSLIFFDKLNS